MERNNLEIEDAQKCLRQSLYKIKKKENFIFNNEKFNAFIRDLNSLNINLFDSHDAINIFANPTYDTTFKRDLLKNI
jgi:hypothetical protein